jgi:chromosome segregation ATPase
MLKPDKKTVIIFILLLALIFNLIGCSKSNSDNNSSEKASNKKKVPNNLEVVDNKTTELVSNLKEIKEKIKEKNKKDKQKEKQGKKEELKKELERLWSKADELTQQLNTSWNNFEVTAQEKNARPEVINKFEKHLNMATEAVKKKEMEKALINTNKLNLRLIPFFEMYETEKPVELKGLKFYAQEIIFLNDSWKQRKEDIMQSKSLLDSLKNEIENKKKTQEKFNKLKNSILDLEEVVQQKKEELIEVKGEIVLENIEELRKK